MSTLTINEKRLWSRIMEIGEIGAIKGTTGSNRQALTDNDKIGRDLFIKWAKEAGCVIRVDKIGNIFARLEGADNSTPAVITGSHLDTQPTGGKFDGIYGCLAGLEVIQTIVDNKIKPLHPIEVIVWTNEEGCRFSTALMGSAVWSGSMPLEEAYSLKDSDGKSVKEELARIGFLGNEKASHFAVKAAFEAHIEQGPVLEHAEKTIGIVKSVQWMSRHKAVILGQEAHAGPTPMRLRKDPIQALARILPQAYESAKNTGDEGRITFGYIDTQPGSNNTVPGILTFTIDIRHPEQAHYQTIIDEVYQIVQDACEQLGLKYSLEEFWASAGLEFDDSCITAVESAVSALGYSSMAMFSGAGHDACNVSSVVPTSMIFIPCREGLSHNVNEFAESEHVAAGCNVLLHAMLNQAIVEE